MGGRWIVLDNGDRIVDKAFVADQPQSDLKIREAIIDMATRGIEAGDTLKVIEGTSDKPPVFG